MKWLMAVNVLWIVIFLTPAVIALQKNWLMAAVWFGGALVFARKAMWDYKTYKEK